MRAVPTRVARLVVPHSTHHRLPPQRPVLAQFPDRLGIWELQAVHLLLCDDLLVCERLWPIGDVTTARAAEIGQAEIALHVLVEPEIQEFIREFLVAAANRYGGEIRHAQNTLFRPDHAEWQAAINIIGRASAPVRRYPHLAVLEIRHGL